MNTVQKMSKNGEKKEKKKNAKKRANQIIEPSQS
jgi:hypothetical protein